MERLSSESLFLLVINVFHCGIEWFQVEYVYSIFRAIKVKHGEK